MINGVITNQLQILDSLLLELRSLGEVTGEQLQQNWRTRRAIERDLQVLIEVMVDICYRLIALQGQSPPVTSYGAIERCEQLGILASASSYRKMVQFRNLIVHRYEYVEVAVLADIVNHHLLDIDLFRREILAYVQG